MADRQSEMSIKVNQHGSNLGLKLPPDAVQHLRLKAGDLLEIRITVNSIILRRPHSRKVWREEELLNGVTPECHSVSC